MRLFRIKTLGCKVNQYETQAMREGLLSAGYQEAEGGQKPDLCIVNTCTVTAKADRESREAIRRFMKENRCAEIVAAGCYVKADSQAIKAIDERIKIVGNDAKLDLVDILQREDYFVDRSRSKRLLAMTGGITYFKGHTKAFVKVQDGCDNFCSYCKVPYVRGGSKSRNPEEVLKETEGLIQNGYKELVLTGICLGDFGKDLDESINLVWLIRRACDIKGIFRIRLSSIELPDVSDGLIDEMADSTKLCSHLHIPLQSGDNQILKKMNRRYTASEFMDRIAYLRLKIPDLALTTDIMVGFPDETESDFKNTLEAVKKIKPSRAHIFRYSPRKGTRAFEMGDNVFSEVKNRRFKQLKELTDRLTEEFRSESFNKKQRVLVENTRDKETGLLCGYTDTYIKVSIDGPDELMGRLFFLDAPTPVLAGQKK